VGANRSSTLHNLLSPAGIGECEWLLPVLSRALHEVTKRKLLKSYLSSFGHSSLRRLSVEFHCPFQPNRFAQCEANPTDISIYDIKPLLKPAVYYYQYHNHESLQISYLFHLPTTALLLQALHMKRFSPGFFPVN
jgi:hypothetical protein